MSPNKLTITIDEFIGKYKKDIDLIIVTPVSYYEQIYNELRNFNIMIKSLEDVL